MVLRTLLEAVITVLERFIYYRVALPFRPVMRLVLGKFRSFHQSKLPEQFINFSLFQQFCHIFNLPFQGTPLQGAAQAGRLYYLVLLAAAVTASVGFWKLGLLPALFG